MCRAFGPLHPIHFENQKVFLALQIFDETTVVVFNVQDSVKTVNLSH